MESGGGEAAAGPGSLRQASDMGKTSYKDAGVDTTEADAGLTHIVDRLMATWPQAGDGRQGRPLLPMRQGYFANVLDVGGKGIALCTDGVGSKSVVATMIGKYDTIGIDCVAMNVNDMICVGAEPLSMVDYIAIDKADAKILDEIGIGLAEGAARARISISGGEIAQLKDIVTGFDLAGTAVGQVELDRIVTGSAVAPGDIVIGVNSSGVHSNGLTLARQAFFAGGKIEPSHKFDELSGPIGEELLIPTEIYVREALEILAGVEGVKALINITGDGLLNLTRVEAEVGFEIDRLIEPLPVFGLIQKLGKVDDATMYEVFNMGIGFCYVVAPGAVDATLSILRKHRRAAQAIGHVIADPTKTVHILERGLEGRHKTFAAAKDGAARRRA
jgi:phosphoribosylformylglycinamidine cyclo-ligase